MTKMFLIPMWSRRRSCRPTNRAVHHQNLKPLQHMTFPKHLHIQATFRILVAVRLGRGLFRRRCRLQSRVHQQIDTRLPPKARMNPHILWAFVRCLNVTYLLNLLDKRKNREQWGQEKPLKTPTTPQPACHALILCHALGRY